jgi:hypothetical protein
MVPAKRNVNTDRNTESFEWVSGLNRLVEWNENSGADRGRLKEGSATKSEALTVGFVLVYSG